MPDGGQPKRARVDNEPLLRAIDAAEQTAYGSDINGVLSRDRADAISRYLGTNLIPAEEGRSQVLSRDVFDTIEWIKPSLLRIFTGNDDLVKFEPHGPEDEAAADQESDYVNYIVTQRNDWYQIMHDWATDALLTRNGYALVYWDTEKIVEKEFYADQPEDVIALVTQDEDSEILGATPKQQPDGSVLYDLQISRMREHGRVCISVLPPERCRISERTPDWTLKECPYFEYQEQKTISDLRAMGFDVPDDIGDETYIDRNQIEDQARDRFNESVYRSSNALDADPSMREVTVRMIWIRHDSDGDGIAEMLYCIRVGQELLHVEECERIWVAPLVTLPLPHRHIGLSIDDMIADIQDIKTIILRQGLDNLYLTNNQRQLVSENVNLDDLLISRPGGIVRMMNGGKPGVEYAPLQTQFVFPQAMQGMEYMDQIRENRTGTNRYFTGVDQNALNKTAHGIAQLTSSAAQRVEQIARTFAAGVEQLFSLVHECILKHARQKDVVRLRNKWVTVDPTTWRSRKDLRLSVGTSAGNKEMLMGSLMQFIGMQMKLLPLGVTDPHRIYNTLAEIAAAAGFANPDKFFSDPQQQGQPQVPPQLMQQMQQMQQAVQKLQQENMQLKAGLPAKQWQIQADQQTEQAKAQIEAVQHNGEMQIEQQKIGSQEKIAAAELESKERQVLMQLAADVLKTQMTAQQTAETPDEPQPEAQAVNEQALLAMMAVIQQMAATMAAPKRIIRDDAGRPIGMETIQ